MFGLKLYTCILDTDFETKLKVFRMFGFGLPIGISGVISVEYTFRKFELVEITKMDARDG
jgi:hypothetical protein